MTWLLFVLAVAVLAPPAYFAAWRGRRHPVDSLIRDHLLERYVVTVTSGETFSGLLAQVDDRSVVLREVTVLSTNDSSAVDGELVLRRESVAYMQRP